MRRTAARIAHAIPDRPPLQLSVGEEVEVGERSDDWPAFVFVVAPPRNAQRATDRLDSETAAM
jgi:hypothetical protein